MQELILIVKHKDKLIGTYHDSLSKPSTLLDAINRAVPGVIVDQCSEGELKGRKWIKGIGGIENGGENGWQAYKAQMNGSEILVGLPSKDKAHFPGVDQIIVGAGSKKFSVYVIQYDEGVSQDIVVNEKSVFNGKIANSNINGNDRALYFPPKEKTCISCSSGSDNYEVLVDDGELELYSGEEGNEISISACVANKIIESMHSSLIDLPAMPAVTFMWDGGVSPESKLGKEVNIHVHFSLVQNCFDASLISSSMFAASQESRQEIFVPFIATALDFSPASTPNESVSLSKEENPVQEQKPAILASVLSLSLFLNQEIVPPDVNSKKGGKTRIKARQDKPNMSVSSYEIPPSTASIPLSIKTRQSTAKTSFKPAKSAKDRKKQKVSQRKYNVVEGAKTAKLRQKSTTLGKKKAAKTLVLAKTSKSKEIKVKKAAKEKKIPPVSRVKLAARIKSRPKKILKPKKKTTLKLKTKKEKKQAIRRRQKAEGKKLEKKRERKTQTQSKISAIVKISSTSWLDDKQGRFDSLRQTFEQSKRMLAAGSKPAPQRKMVENIVASSVSPFAVLTGRNQKPAINREYKMLWMINDKRRQRKF